MVPPAFAAEPSSPLDLQREEQVRVRLVLVEVLVTDRSGATVPGLGPDDFTLLVQNSPVEIDTLDAACSGPGLPDPSPRDGLNQPLPDPPDAPARIVLLFDHYHMDMGDRRDALASAREILAAGIREDDRLMVAVLSDGLRLLQPFTGDRKRLAAALDRMEQDVSLWAKLFDPPYRPLTEKGYFEDLSRLMNVLAGHQGAKAVILFSSFLGRSDDHDLWYLDVAHRAAESRTVLYPVYARGLEPPSRDRRTEPVGGSRALARLANETGGRFTRLTNDLSLAYRRARRDLACRYTLGFYLEESGRNQVEDSRNITVRVQGRGRMARHPERVREWTAGDLRAARVQAAESEPERYLDRSVRAGMEQLKRKGERRWEVRLEAAAGATPSPASAAVLLTRHRKVLKRFDRSLSAGRDWRFRETVNLAAGEYELVVVLDDPSRPVPVTAVESIRIGG